MSMQPLNAGDYRVLSERYIDLRWADAAGIKRVDNFDGADLVAGNPSKRDHAGMFIPYRNSEGRPIGGRLRRDHPEVERGSDGTLKPKGKYLSAPGDRPHLYFPPEVPGSAIADINIPIIITEGEFKAIALRRLASHQMGESLRFVPMALAGVWAFLGKIGKHADATGQMVAEHGALPDFAHVPLKGRQVTIAFDMDVKTNASVRAARFKLSTFLLEQGARVGVVEWQFERDGRKARGIDDWLARDGPEAVLEALSKVEYRDGSNWRSRLLCSDTGKPKGLLENARVALSDSDDWRGVLVYDSFLGQVTCSRRAWNNAAGPWTDNDSIQLACWLQRHGIEVGQEVAYAAVMAAARQANCAAEWLHSLEWDGEPRLDSWLIKYMGARTSRDGHDITHYVCAVGAAWLIGGVSRVLDPGCQMDYCLVLCGAEGLYKSSALRILSNGWFSDSMRDITSQFAPVQLASKLIIEFSELEAWGRADANQLKGFITRREDHFRAPFARVAMGHPRQCIFAGTSNDLLFIREDGENRRFWPIECGPVGSLPTVDLAALERDYVQLWAEARERYELGARPYLRDKVVLEQASIERSAFKQADPWLSLIATFCANRPEDSMQPITTTEVLQGALSADKHRMSKADTARVTYCLRALGYQSCQFGPKRLSGWRMQEGEGELLNGHSHDYA